MESFEDTFRDELLARRRPSWREPFHWWGPGWRPPEPSGLHQLVEGGVLTREMAGTLRGVVSRGGSVVVAAGPSQVGKSTLADALAGEVPAERTKVYVRGGFETFDFLEAVAPPGAALLVNEFSPHLPIYLWGSAARRTLQLARDGAQVIGTIHAASPEEIVYQLSGARVSAAPVEVAALGTIVFLGPSPAAQDGRWRVGRVVQIRAGAHGVVVKDIA